MIARQSTSPFSAPFPHPTPYERAAVEGFVGPADGNWGTALTVQGALQRRPALVSLSGTGESDEMPGEPLPRKRLSLAFGTCGSDFLANVGRLLSEQVGTLVLVEHPSDEKCMLILPYLAHSYDFDVVLVSNHSSAAVPFHVDHAVAVHAAWTDVQGVLMKQGILASFRAALVAGLLSCARFGWRAVSTLAELLPLLKL